MTTSIRVLTAPSLDAAPSLLLVQPDGQKILVDCGEGCQRALIQHAQRISSIAAVCLTQVNSESVGGLPGFLLTLSDIVQTNRTANLDGASNKTTAPAATDPRKHKGSKGSITVGASLASTQGSKERKGPLRTNHRGPLHNRWPFCPLQDDDRKADLHLYGPPALIGYLEALRHFLRRTQFRVRVFSQPTTPMLAVPIDKSAVDEPQTKKQKRQANQPTPMRFSVTSIPFGHTRSYVFTTPALVGKFLVERAQALGVPRGPLYAQLKAGKSVTFCHQGVDTTVHTADVVTPSSPGLAVLVLRYPASTEPLAAFFEALHLPDCLAGATLDVVVHLAAPAVYRHATAHTWRQRWAQAQHLWMKFGQDGATPHRAAAATAQVRANLCPAVFVAPWDPPVAVDRHHNDDGVLCTPGMEFLMVPRTKRGFVNLPTDDDAQERQRQADETGAQALAAQIMDQHNPRHRNTLLRQGLGTERLLFTGTASAMPCKYRNVTGMLLTNSHGRGMLLDVGEGTVGQLLRMQATEPDVETLLASITVAWVSHPHADHHLGLLRLLELRKAAEPLLLISPPPILRFLQEYADTVDPRIAQTYRAMDARDFLSGDNKAGNQRLQDAIGFSRCQVVQVEHCAYSYGIILDGTPYGRLVYSGDCRPCPKLARLAKPADLLIHESTFEDSMKSEAFLKKHSTAGEALEIAKAMQAKCTVLTHFSQRYPRIPPPTKVMDTTGMTIIFAFDFQMLVPQTLALAAALTPALRKLYALGDDRDAAAEDASAESQARQTLSTPGLFAKSELL